ncbi:exosome complex exonuclease-like protein Rrp6 [Myriangium duriaei CBS 260.36]|uniref:Exosome complex exonuclease-like protein Rrp6 n=1 Tax=Myriangium duriaei CBS 260.36 TaxID=1168546 RepID=A0A9P4J052_9PEZI|nr:exosome complex exonuclease-like protein Rrp6 [Myriangium duriaei CBS 260.36]
MASEGDSKSLIDSISASLVAVTRTANQLAAEDFDFHRSLNPAFGTDLDKQNARLLDLAQCLVGNAASGAKAVRPRLTDADAIDDNWRSIVDVLDSLLEKADTSLDEFSGAVKRLSPARDQPASPRPSRISAAIKSREITKPQLSFDVIPTNTEIAPFYPLLPSKPHASVPLKESLTTYEGEHDGLPHVTHPYRTELERYEYPSFVYTRAEPQQYLPFESTTATLVDTEEALEEMLEELKQAKEIAIDLEHHDYRSYIGIVSLMQISTRKRDWIVDTLKPWRRKFTVLNEVFADPNILKVLHGAHMDIIWLQRDLGLYVVGLFDTYHAARVLGYPGGSLAFLLKKFINFDAQKQYQTADWRIRPLPQELFDYARSDTHFLLFIYDNMRNELIDRSHLELQDLEHDKVHDVLKRSKETALQTYNHPMYDAKRGLGSSGWYKSLSRYTSNLSKEQFSVFRRLHQWRDQVAREQDDSTHYVLPQHHLFTLAKEMPSEKAQLFKIVQPTPQSIKMRIDEVLEIIENGKAVAQDEGLEMRDVLREIDVFLHGDLAAEAAPSIKALPAPEVLPQLSAPHDAPAPLLATAQMSLSSLRAKTSSFWGIFKQPDNRKISSLSPRLYVPLPPLTAEIFATPETPSAATKANNMVATPTSNGIATPTASEKENPDIFILRSLSHKRKAESDLATPITTDTDALATQNDEVSIGEDDLNQRRADKARRKAEKKAAKRARQSGDAEEEAFDYGSAPSVFHAQAQAAREAKGKDKKREGRKEKEVFTLAKGLGDVQRGLGKRQKETGGRSMTFKD